MKYSRKGVELIPMSTRLWAKYPSPRKLGIGVLGYLLVDIVVETTLGALWRQVLFRLANLAWENLFAKCTSCSFNSSTPKLLFEYTSPRKLGSVSLNMNSGVLEHESVKLSPFSRELHLKFIIIHKLIHCIVESLYLKCPIMQNILTVNLSTM